MKSIQETTAAETQETPVPSFRIPPGVNENAVNVRRGMMLAVGVPRDMAERFAIEAEQSQNARNARARSKEKPSHGTADTAAEAILNAQASEPRQAAVSDEAEALAKREAALTKREEALAKAEAKLAKKSGAEA